MAGSAVIGALRVNLGIDSAQFSNGLKKAGAGMDGFSKKASRSAAALGGAFTRLAGIITGVLASAFAAISLDKFIKASVQADQVQAQLAASLKSTAGASGQTVASLNETAAALQKVTNFGDEVINSAQGILLTFTRIRGDKFNETTEAVLNVATAMKMDLKSAAIQVGKALNDPVQGMTALSRSGITFTESQKETVKQMMAVGDIAGAQTLILKELETQFGGSARAARGVLGGALTSLKNAWGDLFELGKSATEPLRLALEELIVAIQNPAFVTFVKTIGGGLVMAFALAVDGATLLVNGISLATGAITDNLDTIKVAALTAGTMLALAFGPAIFTAIVSNFAVLARAGVAAIYAITAAMARNPLGALAVGITIAITALFHFRDQVQQAIGVDVIGIIADAANKIINSFRAAFEGIKFVWKNLPTIIGAAAIGAVNEVIEAVNDMVNKAVAGIDTLIGAINNIPGVEIDLIGKLNLLDPLDNPFADELAKNLEAHNARIQEIMASNPLGSLGEMFSTTTPEIQDFTSEIAKANAGLEKAAGGMGKAGSAAAAAKPKIKELGTAGADVGNIMQSVGQTIQSAFSSAIDGLINGTFKAKEAISKLLADLGKLLINKAFQTLFSGGGGGGGGLFGSLFAGFFAHGGRIPAGQYGIVGEAGPELIRGPAEVTPMEMVAGDNGAGGSGAAVAGAEVNVRNVNVFDPSDMLERALGTRAGERVLLNFVNQNSGALNGALARGGA